MKYFAILFIILSLPLQAERLLLPGYVEPEYLPLWADGMPGSNTGEFQMQITQRASNANFISDRIATGISQPDLALFPAQQPNGRAVLIIPGGGYQRVVMDKEGYETAQWLNKKGISAFVLRYRLPGEGWRPRQWVGLQDAQRAMRVIRSLASKYRFDATQVGVIGFSAGGHLAGLLATNPDQPLYDITDENDLQSVRPAFAALIYPVISMDAAIAHPGSRERLLGATPAPELVQALSVESRVRPGMPPIFLLHALDDDAVPVANSQRLQQALEIVGIEVDAHYFATGGHGFGLRFSKDLPVGQWPQLMLDWMEWRIPDNSFRIQCSADDPTNQGNPEAGTGRRIDC